jgi:photosystem II stability/assembly factor-like uncharacterized protein
MKFKKIHIQTFAILVVFGILLSGPQSPRPSTADSLYPAAEQPGSALAAPETGELFFDNFNGGTGAWNLDGTWAVVSDGGNPVLDGQGHGWAWVRDGQYWTDYTFNCRVKILSGAIQLMFRFTEDHGRYILGITPGEMYLRKESPWEKISTDLATHPTDFNIGVWYDISVDMALKHIQVTVNGEGIPRIDYTDPSFLNTWPLWQGTIGLETVPDASAHSQIDDIWVYGVVSPERIWTRTGGPIGGLGYDIRYGSSINEMYVTDNYSGVFKSSNNGATWYPSNRGITGRFWPSGDAIPVFTLNVDPNNINIVWAGLKDVKGVFKSTDSGMTWSDKTPSSTVLPESNFVFRAFTVMPGNSNIVFAAGEIPSDPIDPGKEFDRVGGRVLRTDDGGATWKSIWYSGDLPGGGNLTRYVIIRPDNPNIIYISTGIFDREADNSDCANSTIVRGGVGVLKGTYDPISQNYSWDYLDEDNGLTDLYVGSLVMHPTNPDILLAGTGNNGCSQLPDNYFTGGVFITDDGGDSWYKTLDDDIITSVEFSPSNPKIAYAGGRNNFYRSEDGGLTWTPVAGMKSPQEFPWGPPGTVAGFPIDLLVDPGNPDVIFANNYGGGNVKSEDGGVHWTIASQGYTGALLYDVEIRLNHLGTVYTTGKSGIFRTLSGGSSWVGLTYPEAPLVETYSVAVNPSDAKIVIASDELMGSVYRSQDGGFSWVKVHQLETGGTFGRHGFKRIVFATSNNEIVYAGACVDHVTLNGDTSKKSYGVFKSVDGGITWDYAYHEGDAISDTCVNNLAVHPDDPQIVYAATANEGLYKTEDGGASWSHLDSLIPLDIRAVAINPQHPDTIYAGTDFHGIYINSSGGIGGWDQLIPGMEPNDRIWAIVFDPHDPQTVYAGSFLTGVYQWLPDEHRWSHINLGLRTKAVTDLAISSDGSVLYAATYGEGVFRLGKIPITKVYLPLLRR